MALAPLRKADELWELKSQMIDALKKIDPDKGIPGELVDYISDYSKVFSTQELCEFKLYCPDLARLMLENTYYDVALSIGLDNIYSKARALSFANRINEFKALLEEMTTLGLHHEVNALKLNRLKFEGRVRDAMDLFEKEISSHLTELAPITLADVTHEMSVIFSLASQQERFLELVEMALPIVRANKLWAREAHLTNATMILMGNLGRQTEQLSYMRRLEEILANYHLSSMDKALYIYKLSQKVKEKKFIEIVGQFDSFMREQKFSVYQMIQLLRLYTYALLETGRLRECDYVIQRLRKLISSSAMYYMDIYLHPLEIDRLSLKLSKINLSNAVGFAKSAIDFSIFAHIQLTTSRLHRIRGEYRRAQQLVSRVCSEIDPNILPVIWEPDFDLENLSIETAITPRAREQVLFRAIKSSDLVYLRAFLEMDEIQNPQCVWDQSLQLLAKIVLIRSGRVQDREEIIADCEKGLLISESNGIERMAALFLKILSSYERSYTDDWLKTLTQLEENGQIEILNVLENLGSEQRETSSYTITTKLGLRRAADLEEVHNCDYHIALDLVHDRVYLSGQISDISHSPLQIRLLNVILSAEAPITKEDLVQKVWGYEYHPLTHDSLVYTSIGRLREYIKIDFFRGGYRIDPSLQWMIVTQSRQSQGAKLKLTERHQKIISLFGVSKEFISRNDLVEGLGMAERTALRDLVELVDLMVLERQGQGRGVKYSLRESYRK